jgi:hypothetical protein
MAQVAATVIGAQDVLTGLGLIGDGDRRQS